MKDQPQGIFRRHDNCDCTVIYDGQVLRGQVGNNGRRSKKWVEVPKDAGAAEPVRLNKEQAKKLEQEKLKINKSSIDNSEKSGIINEKANRPITKITDKAIESVPLVKIPEYSLDESVKIQKEHKALLKYSKDNNNNGECAFVLSNGLNNKKEFVGTDDMLDFGSNGLVGSNLFIMHNHPRNSSFSDRDVIILLDNANVKALSIVKNNGKVEVLVKNNDFSLQKAKTELSRCYKKYVKKYTNEEINKAIHSFIKSGKGGVSWITE
jgi:hypothetical protein